MITNEINFSLMMKKIMGVMNWCVFILLLLFLFVISGFSQGTDPNPDDARWDNKFGLGGFDGYINAIARAENGNIYVGGDFDLLNGEIVSGIAMWDGAEWHPLGKGLTGGWNDGVVFTITIDGDKVYVGGDFTEAGEIGASRIAMWDGANWNALGSGIDAPVYAIAVDGDNVYAGGYRISEAGGVSVNGIAKWDGQNWSAMGNGIDSNFNDVYAIVAKNDTVYVGGGFQKAGEDTVNYIIYWDGQNWNPMGSGMDRSVHALAFGDDVLYAGGQFKQAGGDTANFIAHWDGSEWNPVGNGVSSTVSTIVVKGTDLYLGGRFTKADTIEALRVVKWDGEKWHTFAGGTNNDVNAIAVIGDNIYVGGEFEEVDGKEENYFAQWDGAGWTSVGKIQDQSVNGDIYAIAIDGKDVYVGGIFTRAGGDTANNIAKWDGHKWSSLGEGFNSKVSAIAVNNGIVYAGGSFGKSGDLPVSRIAKWDGEQWSGLSTGMNNQVYAIAVHGDDIYVGGNFTSAGSIWARRIARWDGETWHALGGDGSLNGAGGLDGYPNSTVTSIDVDRDTIYVGGFFASAIYQDGYIRVKSVVKWDGENWHALGPFSNVNEQRISSISVNNGIIYAAGSFPRVGDIPANKVVRWNGVEWIDIGDEMYYSPNPTTYTGKINSVIEINGIIYAGGGFDVAGEKTVNYLVRWDGQEWSSLGNSMNDHVYALAADSTYLYAGGRFTITGDKGSSRLGRYDVSGAVGIRNDRINIIENYALYQNYPNPFNPVTAISYRLPAVSDVALSVYNVLGQKIATLITKKQPAGVHTVEWNAGHMASGVYYYQIIAGEFQDVRKMILIK